MYLEGFPNDCAAIFLDDLPKMAAVSPQQRNTGCVNTDSD